MAKFELITRDVAVSARAPASLTRGYPRHTFILRPHPDHRPSIRTKPLQWSKTTSDGVLLFYTVRPKGCWSTGPPCFGKPYRPGFYNGGSRREWQSSFLNFDYYNYIILERILHEKYKHNIIHIIKVIFKM